ncbi:MAG: cardiolipin synthase, partial [Rikenellaceae bacterium]|nr:cardiolipin synthase [Rikenellaceae bacterium]
EDNSEVSTFIYDRATVNELTVTLEDYIAHSRRVMPQEWYSRPHGQRFIEAIARLVSPLF